MNGQSLYDILGVTEDASESEIREAFLVASSRCTAQGAPDPTREACLVAVREAYAILGNAQERAGYDSALALRRRPTPARVLPDPALASRACMLIGVAIMVAVVWNGWSVMQAQREARTSAIEFQARAQERMVEAERRAAEGVSMRGSPLLNDWERNDVAYRNDRSFENVRNQVDRITVERGARESMDRWEAQRRMAERRREQRAIELQAAYDNERQLERDKAYLRELEMDNRRFSLR